MYDTIERSLIDILSKKDNITIVQIGAHDGVFYDPIYNIVKMFKDKTKILLVEPQDEIMPILKENYSYHPNAFFSQTFVGDGKDAIFYYFKPEYYKYYWYEGSTTVAPEYVNPTGVSTTNLKTFQKHYNLFFHNKNISFEESYETKYINTLTIKDLLSNNPVFLKPDVLVIDTEGDDDQILYHNDWEIIKPELIIFEKLHFTSDQENKIVLFLQKLNYVCIDAVEHIVALLFPNN